MARSVQRSPQWGPGAEQLRGSREAAWSCRLFSPGVKLVSLAFWKCYKMYHRTSIFAGTTLWGRGLPPMFSHRFCANFVSGPGGQWGGGEPPQIPRGLATAWKW